MALGSELSTLGALLQDRSEKHGVVGAALAVGRGDEIFETSTGLVNRNTGVDVTVDSVFQIGSITKLFTTTLIMQLVDEGALEHLVDVSGGDARAALNALELALLAQSGQSDQGKGGACGPRQQVGVVGAEIVQVVAVFHVALEEQGVL